LVEERKKNFRAGRWAFIGPSGAAAPSGKKKECPLGKKEKAKENIRQMGIGDNY
jgi:hypothetical protein